jgi:ribosomal protein S12 methylthiotransferase accessory factor
MPLEQARAILPNATYRPPVRRGDLDSLPAGRVVGIIDGVFDQTLSVSPREIYNALRRGVRILGSSSMGAMRAAEVRGVVGIGRVYEMFRDGTIDRDDEVALLFEPESFRPITEPLVNIRYAVDRLVRSGTIDRELGQRIMAAARKLHYRDRHYRLIVREAGLEQAHDVEALIQMLRSYDLKREDAQLLLETMPAFCAQEAAPPALAEGAPPAPQRREYEDHFSEARVQVRMPSDAPVLIWEYGDGLDFHELVRFLKLTGEFKVHAQAALTRFLLQGNTLSPRRAKVRSVRKSLPDRHQLLRDLFSEWGWSSAEEARVTLADVGLGLETLLEHLDEEVDARRAIAGVVLEQSPEFLKALRSQLAMDRLALKRAALRLGAFKSFARRGKAEGQPLQEQELKEARLVVCQLSGTLFFEEAVRRQAPLGIQREELEAFVEELAQARRGALPVIRAMEGKAPARRRKGGLELSSSPKAPGSLRFCLPLAEAEPIARKVASVIGVTRVAMVGELTELGVQISQAYRPHSRWSTTAGSGKSETRAGARVGGIMEEAEKHAQEKFHQVELTSSYARLRQRADVVDPATLDLPYDSRYHEELEIEWSRCFELLSGRQVYVPAAAVIVRRLKDDIYYSARRGHKVFSSNGLASGFTLEEALNHAVCELIERHATRLAELQLNNPRVGGAPPFRFVDLSTVPASIQRLARKLTRSEYQLRVLEITSEIRVPTFKANLFTYIDPYVQTMDGTATHPNAEVAMQMAMLEAAQTKVASVAGSREDLTVKARSLGRHERPRCFLEEAELFWYGPEPAQKPFSSIESLTSRDVRDDLMFALDALRRAGFEQVLAIDYSLPEIAPVRAVRVLVPGLETTNPFYTGPRARAVALRDVLPWTR